ncbi:hypothetical protein ACFX5U_19985 [Sphingobacterium sp. SG20118]|uniref:hypothetical protein n=1 Tax=Sphingobacterium sp. SG20118 TaxID=3367156 RepID=UPI0037DFC8DC
MILRKDLKKIIFLGWNCIFGCLHVVAQNQENQQVVDSLGASLAEVKLDSVFGIPRSEINAVSISSVSTLPLTSLQQFLKANNTGLFINESSGEPGNQATDVLPRNFKTIVVRV